LTATTTLTDRVDLYWKDVATALGYEVYRSTILGQAGSIIARPVDHTYSDFSAVAGTVYWFSVTATNTTGSSAFTAQVRGLRAVGTAAPTISGFTATPSSLPAGGGSVTLTATVTNATQVLIDGGDVTAGLSGTTLTVMATLAATHTFTLTAIGTTPPNATAQVTVTVALPAPTGLTATTTLTDRVDLYWNQVATALGYEVYRSTTPGQAGSIIARPVDHTYSDFSAVVGTVYWYSVTASNAAGTSGFSAQVEGLRAAVGPAAPTISGFTATPSSLGFGGGSVRLQATVTDATSVTLDGVDRTAYLTGTAFDFTQTVTLTHTFALVAHGVTAPDASDTVSVTVDTAPPAANWEEIPVNPIWRINPYYQNPAATDAATPQQVSVIPFRSTSYWVMGDDGLAYYIGGGHGTYPMNDVDMFNTATLQWRDTCLGVDRGHVPPVTWPWGRIYSGGGQTSVWSPVNTSLAITNVTCPVASGPTSTARVYCSTMRLFGPLGSTMEPIRITGVTGPGFVNRDTRITAKTATYVVVELASPVDASAFPAYVSGGTITFPASYGFEGSVDDAGWEPTETHNYARNSWLPGLGLVMMTGAVLPDGTNIGTGNVQPLLSWNATDKWKCWARATTISPPAGVRNTFNLSEYDPTIDGLYAFGGDGNNFCVNKFSLTTKEWSFVWSTPTAYVTAQNVTGNPSIYLENGKHLILRPWQENTGTALLFIYQPPSTITEIPFPAEYEAWIEPDRLGRVYFTADRVNRKVYFGMFSGKSNSYLEIAWASFDSLGTWNALSLGGNKPPVGPPAPDGSDLQSISQCNKPLHYHAGSLWMMAMTGPGGSGNNWFLAPNRFYRVAVG